MDIESFKSKLAQVGEGAQAYLAKKWEDKKKRRVNVYDPAEAAWREHMRLQVERNLFLALITSKLTSDSHVEMPPLVYDPTTPLKAVFLITTPVTLGKLEVSKQAYQLLARHLGMSMNSISHWLLVVADRGAFAPCFCYDLMSDHLSLNMLGKNYFRAYELTPEMIETWSSCTYVGETFRGHDEISHLGINLMAINPRYNLISNNCQDLAENLVKELCNGKVINQAKLKEELSLISPKIARDLIAARLRSRIDAHGEAEDSDSVKADIELVRRLSVLESHQGRSPSPIPMARTI